MSRGLDQLLASFLAPDPSDIQRHHSANRNHSFDSPERRLWLACLEGAIVDLLRPLRKSYHRKTVEWMEDKLSHGPGSFNFVCQSLGIDPTAARKKLFDQLAALGGSEAVLAPTWREKTTNKRGARLCQLPPTPIEEKSSSAPKDAPAVEENISSVPSANSAAAITPHTHAVNH